jgi:hypothetical protein
MKYALLILLVGLAGCSSGPKIMKKCIPAQEPLFICEDI